MRAWPIAGCRVCNNPAVPPSKAIRISPAQRHSSESGPRSGSTEVSAGAWGFIVAIPSVRLLADRGASCCLAIRWSDAPVAASTSRLMGKAAITLFRSRPAFAPRDAAQDAGQLRRLVPSDRADPRVELLEQRRTDLVPGLRGGSRCHATLLTRAAEWPMVVSPLPIMVC